jgi:hypothetical protein
VRIGERRRARYGVRGHGPASSDALFAAAEETMIARFVIACLALFAACICAYQLGRVNRDLDRIAVRERAVAACGERGLQAYENMQTGAPVCRPATRTEMRGGL